MARIAAPWRELAAQPPTTEWNEMDREHSDRAATELVVTCELIVLKFSIPNSQFPIHYSAPGGSLFRLWR